MNPNRLKRTLLVSALIGLSSVTIAAHAQFSVGSLLGGSGNSGSGDVLAQQDALVRGYVGADRQILLGQAKMAEALGLKEQSAKLSATADALTDGATKGNLSDADKTLSDANSDIANRLKDNPQLDEAAKARYQEGLALSGRGVVSYLALRTNIDGFRNALSSASPLMIPKLGAGSYIVTTVPGNAKHLSDSMGLAVQYAKSQRIDVPKDATAAI